MFILWDVCIGGEGVGLWDAIINQIRSILKPGIVVCDSETNEKNSKPVNKKQEKKPKSGKTDKTQVGNA